MSGRGTPRSQGESGDGQQKRGTMTAGSRGANHHASISLRHTYCFQEVTAFNDEPTSHRWFEK